MKRTVVHTSVAYRNLLGRLRLLDSNVQSTAFFLKPSLAINYLPVPMTVKSKLRTEPFQTVRLQKICFKQLIDLRKETV